MILEWKETVAEADHHVQEATKYQKPIDPILSDPLCWLARRSKHTLVCHPVGYHWYVFAGRGNDCIENKLLLLAMRRSQPGWSQALGRGGMGPGFFVWALLDWDAVIRQRGGLYLGQGGNPNQRVTEHFMEEFLSQQSVVI